MVIFILMLILAAFAVLSIIPVSLVEVSNDEIAADGIQHTIVEIVHKVATGMRGMTPNDTLYL